MGFLSLRAHWRHYTFCEGCSAVSQVTNEQTETSFNVYQDHTLIHQELWDKETWCMGAGAGVPPSIPRYTDQEVGGPIQDLGGG